MRRAREALSTVVPVAVAALLVARSAGAAPPADPPAAPTADTPAAEPIPAPAAAPIPEWETARPTRRYGFTLGTSYGIGAGDASGYPNDLAKIDDPAWRSHTGGFATGGSLWLGGAITDWFTFGLGTEFASAQGSQAKTSGGAFMFRVQAFPLFERGGIWRDLGVFADFGTGGGTIQLKSGQELANGGAMSMITGGAFWEAIHWFGSRHVVSGPELWWQYQWSNSLEERTGILAFRTQFYGGP